MFLWHKQRPPALLRALAADGRSGTYLTGVIMGAFLLAGGAVMLGLAIRNGQGPPSADSLTQGIVGAVAIATGWALIGFSTLILMAHEILFLTDDEYRRSHAPKNGDGESADTASTDAGIGDDRRCAPSRPRIISTTDLSLGWRWLVYLPLIFACGLIAFALLAGLDPDVGVFAVRYSLPPEQLCFGALLLMMLTGLPLVEGAKRHSKKSRAE